MSQSKTMTIAAMLESTFFSHRQRTVYQEAGKMVEMSEHVSGMEQLLATLQSRYSIKPGDRVAVALETNHQYAMLWHLAMLGNFIIVPLNIRLSEAELASILSNAEPTLFIAQDSTFALAQGAVSKSESEVDIKLVEQLLNEGGSQKAVIYKPGLVADDLVAIMYTGGTTGLPKGVMMSQSGLAETALRLHVQWQLFGPNVCLYATTSLYHISGFYVLMGPVLSGGKTILVPGFDIGSLIQDSKLYGVTHLVLIPTMIDMLISHPEFDVEYFRSLECIAYGGAPMSEVLLQRLFGLFPNVAIQQGYGMTELLGSVSLLSKHEHLEKSGKLLSCGRPLLGVRIEIRDAKDKELSLGEIGEICISSTTMMLGYWQNPEMTEETIRNERYYTGDIGYMDSDGYLFLVDRKKDMIISGGENIYSLEVERALERCNGVAQVAVFGVPHEKWGEQVHAVIVPKPGFELDVEQLKASLGGELATYKHPKSWEIRLEPLPVSGTNKVVKSLLREAFLKS